MNAILKIRTVHECDSELTSTPKAELFCSCKRRKFIGQNFKFLSQKLGCPTHEAKSLLEPFCL